MYELQGILGVFCFVGIAWLLSEARKEVDWKQVGKGLGIHFLLACILYFTPPVRSFFSSIADGVLYIQLATQEGTSFLFGYVGGGDLPFAVTEGGSPFIIAFQTLPVILVVGALSAALWHWGVLRFVVRKISFAVEKSFGLGGAVGVSSAANIFMGMVEAPLLIRPYIPTLTRSELFVVMTAGMATIAGTMMVLIGAVLQSRVPDAFTHILTASVINVPIAITLARIIVPSDGKCSSGAISLSSEYHGTLDAITSGTSEAIKLLSNVIAMIIVFVALIFLVNVLIGGMAGWFGYELTLQEILGVAFAPVAWLLGIPWEDAPQAGALLGTKIVTNEFLAYLDFVALPEGAMEDRSQVIITYALCSFSNLGSLAIMIGGMSAMAPERSREITALGPKSVVSGFLSGLITACVIGLIMNLA